jgi:hypothetical protein
MTAPLLPRELRRLLKARRERRWTIHHWLIGLILAAGYINGAMALVALWRG